MNRHNITKQSVNSKEDKSKYKKNLTASSFKFTQGAQAKTKYNKYQYRCKICFSTEYCHHRVNYLIYLDY
jgi:hypothetical protein